MFRWSGRGGERQATGFPSLDGLMTCEEQLAGRLSACVPMPLLPTLAGYLHSPNLTNLTRLLAGLLLWVTLSIWHFSGSCVGIPVRLWVPLGQPEPILGHGWGRGVSHSHKLTL